jgi:hypothetical protein
VHEYVTHSNAFKTRDAKTTRVSRSYFKVAVNQDGLDETGIKTTAIVT